MRRRPGRKPDQYRRAPRNVEGVEPGLRIPQLRPRYGEEDRGPRVTEVRRRTRRLQRLPMRGYERLERDDGEMGPAHGHHRRHHGRREEEEAGPAFRPHRGHREREQEAGPAHREHPRHRARENEDAGPAHRQRHGRHEEAGPAHRPHHHRHRERDDEEAGPAYGRHHQHREREQDHAGPFYRQNRWADQWAQIYERPQPALVEPQPMPDLDLPPPAPEAPQQRQQEQRIERIRDVVNFDELPPIDPTNVFARMEDVADLLHEVYIPEGQHLHVPRERHRWDIFRNREDVGALVDFLQHQAYHIWEWRVAQAEALRRAERTQQWVQTLPRHGTLYYRGVTAGNLYPERQWGNR